MDILEKIQKVEALIKRAATEGERQSAIQAKERLLKTKEDTEIEYNVTMGDMWQKKLFVAICHKYSLKTYRYHRQKYTTTMVRVSKSFLDGVVWPEFLKFRDILGKLVDEVTADIISKIHKDEEEIVISGEIEQGRDEPPKNQNL
ncbi:MAG: DUF2786 domain-containing protein [Nanoarchaeota archaeon]|nr:DUF2786 domain-containing protein [Nanoarchaeota archaeon]